MPILTAQINADTKVLLDAFATLTQSSLDRVIETIAASYLEALPAAEQGAVKALQVAALSRSNANPSSERHGSATPGASYKFSRLCFKRDVIESLGPNDLFQVDTPVGTFQMSRNQFHSTFANVVQSRSYRENGIYHYRVLPRQAMQFRVN